MRTAKMDCVRLQRFDCIYVWTTNNLPVKIVQKLTVRSFPEGEQKSKTGANPAAAKLE